MYITVFSLSLVLFASLKLSEAVPSTLLGLSNWKLFGFSGSDISKPEYAEYTTLQTQTYEDEKWFFDNGIAVILRCYVGYPTTSGSGNPRVELRQVQKSDGKNVLWDGTSSTQHVMESRLRVDRLPSSGIVSVMQIHGLNDFDDVIRVEFKGEPHQDIGWVNMKISGYVTEELLDGTQILETSFILKKYYDFVLEMKNSVVRLGVNGTEIFKSEEVESKENYFKAGNYLQSVQGGSFDQDDYGVVRIRSLSASPVY